MKKSKAFTAPAAIKQNEKIKQLMARAMVAQAKQDEKDRKRLLHKKIVAGGFFMKVYGANLEKMPVELRPRFNADVRRENDRAAFGLAAIEAAKK